MDINEIGSENPFNIYFSMSSLKWGRNSMTLEEMQKDLLGRLYEATISEESNEDTRAKLIAATNAFSFYLAKKNADSQ